MIDPTAGAIAAVVRGDGARFPLVALAGIVSSLGPCVAPRYIALASLLNGPRGVVTSLAFVTGIVTAYTALGFGAGLLGAVLHHAAAINIVLAVALGAGGLVTLLRRSQCLRSDHEHAVGPHRFSGIFSLGAASALVVSPCCTPMVAAVVAFPSLDATPWLRASLLGMFALGHAAPLLVLGSAGAVVAGPLRRLNASPAPAVISGTLMLALGAYYGALA